MSIFLSEKMCRKIHIVSAPTPKHIYNTYSVLKGLKDSRVIEVFALIRERRREIFPFYFAFICPVLLSSVDHAIHV